MIDLAGRRVLVTGGSRGIGAACCRAVRAGRRRGPGPVPGERGAGQARSSPSCAGSRDAPHADVPLRRHRRRTRSAALFDFVAREWGGARLPGQQRRRLGAQPAGAARRRRAARHARGQRRRARSSAPASALPLLERSPDGNIVNVSSTAGPARRGLLQPLRGEQGRDDLGHQGLVERAGAAGAGQRRGPRLGGHRHDGRGAAPASRGAGGRRLDPARPGRRPPRTSPARSSSSPRRSPATSPARS